MKVAAQVSAPTARRVVTGHVRAIYRENIFTAVMIQKNIVKTIILSAGNIIHLTMTVVMS